MNPAHLQIVTYHYVRELPETRFPRIKGFLLSDFRKQLDQLCDAYEMASLESALAFLSGKYAPSRDLCLLTFDDGLKEHFAEVTPLLAERRVQGIFHVITGCMEEHRVAPVHMNHFLMATLDFDSYKRAFLSEMPMESITVDREIVATTYPLDTPEVGEFKYLFNFVLDATVRDQVVSRLFQRHLGDEEAFSRDLYLSWADAEAMQSAGMAIGGHTHEHRPLATLSQDELIRDTQLCRRLLGSRLKDQPLRPFCYPYGKQNSFNSAVVRRVQREGFDCAFTTESGPNRPGTDTYRINRVDCNRAWIESPRQLAATGD